MRHATVPAFEFQAHPEKLLVFAIVEAAGWPIYLLLIASVVALGLIVERLYSLRNRNVIPAGLLDETIREMKQRGVSNAMLSRLSEHSPLGRVFAAGLKNVKSSPEVMKESIEEAGRTEAHALEQFMTSLGTIASISPLLGLFGTVVGMIEIFGAQNAVGNTPAVLAHGISVALYNTAYGLIVAVPSMIFYRHFRAKVDSLVIEMEQQAIKLVEIVHGERR
jgi:biopolymer transport protein ExbB